MKLLKRQETPTGNIALLAMFSAILASFSLIMAFVPFASIILAFFLPLVSAVATYYTKNRYIPFYIVGASALCVGVTFFNIGDTVFFVVPSIISGSLFGFLRTKNMLSQLKLFIIGVAQFALHVAAYYLLIAVTNVDMVQVISSLLNISVPEGEKQKAFLYLFGTFMLALSYGETALNHLLIEGFLNKFSEENENDHLITRMVLSIISICFGVSCLLVHHFNEYSLGLLFAVTAYFSITGLDFLFIKKRPIWVYVLLGVSLFISMFAIAIFYPTYYGNQGICLIAIFPICLSLVTFVSIIENKMAK